MAEKDKTLELFGVSSESVEKSKDIVPTFDLNKSLKDGETVRVQFTEDEPRTVDTPNSKYQKSANVIGVKVYNDMSDKTGLNYSLFLSSKSLSLGVARLWEKHNRKLKNVFAIIKKTTAVYKEHGENTAYNVQEVE